MMWMDWTVLLRDDTEIIKDRWSVLCPQSIDLSNSSTPCSTTPLLPKGSIFVHFFTFHLMPFKSLLITPLTGAMTLVQSPKMSPTHPCKRTLTNTFMCSDLCISDKLQLSDNPQTKQTILMRWAALKDGNTAWPNVNYLIQSRSIESCSILWPNKIFYQTKSDI